MHATSGAATLPVFAAEETLKMTRVEAIERSVANLSAPELAKFRDWFIEFDAQQWDRQIEEDVASGRLDHLADAALKSLRVGKCSGL